MRPRRMYKPNNLAKGKKRGHCAPCGKKFWEKKYAAQVAATMRRENDEMVHHYKCPHNNGWHIGHPNRQADWDRLRARS